MHAGWSQHWPCFAIGVEDSRLGSEWRVAAGGLGTAGEMRLTGASVWWLPKTNGGSRFTLCQHAMLHFSHLHVCTARSWECARCTCSHIFKATHKTALRLFTFVVVVVVFAQWSPSNYANFLQLTFVQAWTHWMQLVFFTPLICRTHFTHHAPTVKPHWNFLYFL